MTFHLVAFILCMHTNILIMATYDTTNSETIYNEPSKKYYM